LEIGYIIEVLPVRKVIQIVVIQICIEILDYKLFFYLFE